MVVNFRQVILVILVHCSLILTNAGFGFAAVLNQTALQTMPPLLYTTLRAVGCTVILFCLTPLLERPVHFPQRRDWKWLLLLGCTGVLGSQMLYMLGLYFAGGNIASCFQPAIPVIVGCFAMLLRMETFGVLKLAGVLTCGCSALFMAVASLAITPTLLLFLGFVFLTAQVLVAAVYFLALKPFLSSPESTLKPMIVTSWAFLLGSIAITLISMPVLIDPDSWRRPSLFAWGALAFMVMGPSSLGYAAFSWGSRHSSPLFVTLYLILQPLFTALFGWLLFQRPVGWPVAVGGVGIGIGLLLVMLGRIREHAVASKKHRGSQSDGGGEPTVLLGVNAVMYVDELPPQSEGHAHSERCEETREMKAMEQSEGSEESGERKPNCIESESVTLLSTPVSQLGEQEEMIEYGDFSEYVIGGYRRTMTMSDTVTCIEHAVIPNEKISESMDTQLIGQADIGVMMGNAEMLGTASVVENDDARDDLTTPPDLDNPMEMETDFADESTLRQRFAVDTGGEEN